MNSTLTAQFDGIALIRMGFEKLVDRSWLTDATRLEGALLQLRELADAATDLEHQARLSN